MTFRGLVSVAAVAAAVLFSYDSTPGQDVPQKKEKVTAAKSVEPTTKPQVVVTDPFEKPVQATESAKPKSSETKFGNYSLMVTDAPTGRSLENGKFYTVTTWDGTKWVSKRKWFPNKTN